jgi:hypothetical protein
MSKALFALGRTVATPGALGLAVKLSEYIERHVTGDWGRIGRFGDVDLTAEEERLGAWKTGNDAKLNVHALRHGGRILSAYTTPSGTLWVMTEELGAGGNATEHTLTICMLPDEF